MATIGNAQIKNTSIILFSLAVGLITYRNKDILSFLSFLIYFKIFF